MKSLDRLEVGNKIIHKGLTVYSNLEPKDSEFYRNIVNSISVEKDGRKSIGIYHPDSNAPFDSGYYIEQFMEYYTW